MSFGKWLVPMERRAIVHKFRHDSSGRRSSIHTGRCYTEEHSGRRPSGFRAKQNTNTAQPYIWRLASIAFLTRDARCAALRRLLLGGCPWSNESANNANPYNGYDILTSLVIIDVLKARNIAHNIANKSLFDLMLGDVLWYDTSTQYVGITNTKIHSTCELQHGRRT